MGKSAAVAVRAAGARAIITGRNDTTLAAAKAEILSRAGGGDDDVTTARFDATDADAVEAFFAEHAPGSIHHLVCTAGPSNDTSSLEGRAGLKGLQAQLDMKILAQLTPVSLGAGRLADGGCVVLTSGVLSVRPGKGSTALAMANGALEIAARGLANDLGPRLRCCCLSPALTNTEIWSSMPAAKREGMLAGFGSTLPLGRAGESDDVGHAVRFLLENGYVTGITLPVDGGAIVRP